MKEPDSDTSDQSFSLSPRNKVLSSSSWSNESFLDSSDSEIESAESSEQPGETQSTKLALKNDFRISRHIDRVQMLKLAEGLDAAMIVPSPEYVIESGDPAVNLTEMRLFFIDQEKHTPYFEYYFHGKGKFWQEGVVCKHSYFMKHVLTWIILATEHVNYLGYEKNGDPVFVSLEKKDLKNVDFEMDPNPVVRALIRTCKPPTLVSQLSISISPKSSNLAG
jgi:hypothetical protein